MLLALVDQLRCTGSHVESWLVARADVVEGRRMVQGVLGCPVCQVEREVRAGVVRWTPDASVATDGAAARDPDGAAVMRMGALLGLTDGAGLFVLCGPAASVAGGLSGLADVALLLLDPPDDRAAPFATVVRGAPGMPLARGAAHGIAIGAPFDGPGQIASAVLTLTRGGRLVATAQLAVPPGIRELARDATHWVGEREADVVTLGRAALAP